ncbi:Trypsinogen-like protein 3 [Merluccius polli]|uniref:Trypsinogen-like protein 3 n=1 Tax=Merluccius polli TaxID=89951 RepID=A0AA47N1R8_MERPO|nr:Trypsinogen-like protein 3 [Merluccius polli]
MEELEMKVELNNQNFLVYWCSGVQYDLWSVIKELDRQTRYNHYTTIDSATRRAPLSTQVLDIMMKLILLGITLGLAAWCAEASPVKVDKGCQPNARPWHVYLHGEGVSCSGALINKWWIVTSYECNPRPNSSIASLGEHDLMVDEGTEQYIQVAEVIQHSPYRSPLHSLTMVRLSQPAQLNQYIRPIPLPTRCPLPWESCRVSGWGSTNPYPCEWTRKPAIGLFPTTTNTLLVI